MPQSIASSFQSAPSREAADPSFAFRSSLSFLPRPSKPLPIFHRTLAMLVALFLAFTTKAPKPDRYRPSA